MHGSVSWDDVAGKRPDVSGLNKLLGRAWKGCRGKDWMPTPVPRTICCRTSEIICRPGAAKGASADRRGFSHRNRSHPLLGGEGGFLVSQICTLPPTDKTIPNGGAERC